MKATETKELVEKFLCWPGMGCNISAAAIPEQWRALCANVPPKWDWRSKEIEERWWKSLRERNAITLLVGVAFRQLPSHGGSSGPLSTGDNQHTKRQWAGEEQQEPTIVLLPGGKAEIKTATDTDFVTDFLVKDIFVTGSTGDYQNFCCTEIAVQLPQLHVL